ncbi:MAG: hypothetical protein A3A58_00790 [Candidatus Blackburnbacteria bacterium RIFCSPLOWO2_01_FULL_41_27]|uniref:DUF5667 domain-containing protein n=2 Tax=Candidatus Blackburniibacteriota TaxID=1817898 RepID=A0A1G1V773_9BACT|nr:MAG: hypothetical protein A3F61_03105 [Candidatus Blackburnbacteria bacterium RIFCSPHIGHO2_12_FULL_41_13b]OGY14052.1 MAG: hypothetical protein A3A58_00790 [Candidatus Blackburnbacteria bacterium RIFCSPLOWO2_01_FULL_41_27]
MLRRVIYIFGSLIFAFSILGISLLRTSTPDFIFYQSSDTYSQKGFVSPVEYYLPHHGLLPDHPFWPIKALRDKVWVQLTRDPIKRAQLLLLFADKRISMAQELLQNGKGALGVSTAVKAEQYLKESFIQYQEAEKLGMDTADFLQKLTRASLKHREMLEEFKNIAPNDAKSVIVETLNTPKTLYEDTVHELIRKEIDVPSTTTRE